MSAKLHFSHDKIVVKTYLNLEKSVKDSKKILDK